MSMLLKRQIYFLVYIQTGQLVHIFFCQVIKLKLKGKNVLNIKIFKTQVICTQHPLTKAFQDLLMSNIGYYLAGENGIV
jgi:hypothetical protein